MTQRQIELERDGVTRGVERYRADLLKNQQSDREFEGGVGRTLTTRLMAAFIPAVRKLQRQGVSVLEEHWTGGRRTAQWEPAMQAIPATELAYITIRSALAMRLASSSTMNVGSAIGRMANLQLNWNEAQVQERAKTKAEPNHKNRISLMMKRVKHINPSAVRKWIKRLEDLRHEAWSHDLRLRVGCELISLLVQTCPEWFKYELIGTVERGQYKTKRTIQRTSEANEALREAHNQAADAAPWFEPMVCPPAAWQWNEEAEQYEGGYLTHNVPLVKRSMYAHTSVIANPDFIDDTVLEALNAIQATPWAINAPVLAWAIRAHQGKDLDLLPVAPEIDLPDTLDPEVWAALDKPERAKAKLVRKDIHDHNHKLRADREDLRRKLVGAGTFKGEAAIYFPHNLDFRGRCYPLPQDLHPQADDISRGMLRFADAKTLGPHGMMYLHYHVANCYGVDKCGRTDQLAWVRNHRKPIERVALDPMGHGHEFLSKADKPWQFLAACIELVNAYNAPIPTQFCSSLPVFVDGSCNGLQHLSAMIRDKIGADATNLTGTPERRDIYGIIEAKVAAQVSTDRFCGAYNGTDPKPCAANWHGHVTRKVVKRAVMTTPYGLTDIGMRDQLIRDKFCADLDGDVGKNATYMRNLLRASITSTVVAATVVMKWLQNNATIVSNVGRPLTWTTPIGFTVRQAYYKPTMKRVSTVNGVGQYPCIRIYTENPAEGLQIRKQRDAVAPNVIHSFDSAHMMLSVLAGCDANLRHFAVIHDSFGCHAADMPVFLKGIRETFAQIYREDWIKSLQADFQASLGDEGSENLEVITVFTGDAAHDIEGVLDDEYFFA